MAGKEQSASLGMGFFQECKNKGLGSAGTEGTVVPEEVGSEALARSHPHSREEQNSILTSILSLVLYFSTRETTTSECASRPFEGQLSGDSGGARWEGTLGKERSHGKIRKRDILDSSLSWCAMIQGMKRNLTLD